MSIEIENIVSGVEFIRLGLQISSNNFFLSARSRITLSLIDIFTANNEAPPSEEALRDQEVKIMELGEQLKDEGKTQEMTDLIQKVRTVLKFMSKAKAAKLVRIQF